MNNTPTTRPRHALRWVVGLGLVFVVVVGMALQVARRRADERWESVARHWEAEIMNPSCTDLLHNDIWDEARGGTFFREWRVCQWGVRPYGILLQQERYLFHAHIEARLLDDVADCPTELVDDARAILAAIDVELLVEP